MKNFLSGTGVVFSLEMRQRLRGVAWYVLLGVFFLIFASVTVGTSVVVFAEGNAGNAHNVGGPLYSIIIYFVLLLGCLVAPAMSGNAINGDRDAGTLATTQVTLITTGQLVIGKFLAAWATALGFLLVALPFLIYAAIVGGPSPATFAISLVVLFAELGIIAAIGVGLSALIARPLFSVVVTYLSVAALTLGTLIAFSLAGIAIQTQQTQYSYDNIHVKSQTCDGLSTYKAAVPRYDLVWGILAPNPFVVLSDAVPTSYDKDGTPTDLFGELKYSERQAQVSPFTDATPEAACKDSLASESDDSSYGYYNPRHVIDTTVPSWAVGLGIQLILAVAALLGGWARTRTPARRLPRGSRVA